MWMVENQDQFGMRADEEQQLQAPESPTSIKDEDIPF
jgi:hypothetical protein